MALLAGCGDAPEPAPTQEAAPPTMHEAASPGPEDAVRLFYTRLAEGRFEAAYELVGEDFRSRAPLAEYRERRAGLERVGVFEVEPAERERDRAGVDIDVRLVEEGRRRPVHRPPGPHPRRRRLAHRPRQRGLSAGGLSCAAATGH